MMKENKNICQECSGRSMVEMLAVLAIIAVISAGSLAGYSRAIRKHRLNETIEQVALMSTNIRTFFANEGSYTSFSMPVAVKYNLVTQRMYGQNSYLVSPFQGRVTITLDKAYQGDLEDTAFVITYYNLPAEVCVSLATMDWGIEEKGGLIGVSVGSGNGGAVYPYKPSEYFATSEQQRPMTTDEVAEYCAGTPDKADAIVAWKYY